MLWKLGGVCVRCEDPSQAESSLQLKQAEGRASLKATHMNCVRSS